MDPIAVFALLARNRAEYLSEALDSLLSQTEPRRAIVVVDHCSTDSTAQILEDYRRRFPDIVVHRHPQPIDAADNWNFAFRLATDLFPGARYFAWATDHDVWPPDWLTVLSEALDRHPEAVLAYPGILRIGPSGAPVEPEAASERHRFHTLGIADPEARLAAALRGIRGERIYGLHRVSALRKTALWRKVGQPDRLFLLEFTLVGQFVESRETLWHRRVWSEARPSSEQQKQRADGGRPAGRPPKRRRSRIERARRFVGRAAGRPRKRRRSRIERAHLFVGRPPLSSYVPWWLAHAWILATVVSANDAAPLAKRDRLRWLSTLYIGWIAFSSGAYRRLQQAERARRRRRRAATGGV